MKLTKERQKGTSAFSAGSKRFRYWAGGLCCVWTLCIGTAAISGALAPDEEAQMPPDREPPPEGLPISPIDEGAVAEGDQLRPPPEVDPRMPGDNPPWRETEIRPVDRLPPPTDVVEHVERYVAQPEPPVADPVEPRIDPEVMAEISNNGTADVLVHFDIAEPTAEELASLRGPRRAVTAIQQQFLADLAKAKVDTRSYHGFQITAGASITINEEGLAALEALRYIDRIYRNIPTFPTLNVSTEQIGVPDALSVGLSGAGQTVAILDSGTEAGHAFFGGRVVSEACYSQNQCPGATAGPQIGPGTGAPCTTNATCDHGTHVAGIAAGLNNTQSGVARGADIIAINVFSQSNNVNICGVGNVPCIVAWNNDIIDGLERVFFLRNTFDIAAANLSLGGGPQRTGFCNNVDPNMTATINALRNEDIATVISSGNNGFNAGVAFPGCIQNAITVGAVDDNDNVASFSNSGPQIDLMAPGVAINSSDLAGTYSNKNGTSMAAPHVTGAFAVMAQKYPTATVQFIESELENNGVSVTDSAAGMTRPRINFPFGWVWQSGSNSGSIGWWNMDQVNDKYLVGDFDGDGRHELLSIKDPWAHMHRYTGSGWQYMWGTNSGSIYWWNMHQADKYVVGDFDGDGRDELLAIKDPWAHLMKFNGTSWQFVWGTGTGWLGWWNMDNSDKFVAGDFDNDGRDELLSIKDPWHHVHGFNGTGWTWQTGSNSGWIGFWNIGSGDQFFSANTNGTGADELLSFKTPWHHVHRMAGSSWQWVNGTGSGQIAWWNMSNSDWRLALDADGDGDDELLMLKDPWVHMNRNQGNWWQYMWGTGSGQFAYWYMNPGDRYYTGDFDGDGREDILSIKDPWHHVTVWKD